MEQKYTHEQIKIMNIIKVLDDLMDFIQFMIDYDKGETYTIDYIEGVKVGVGRCMKILMEEYELKDEDLL